MKKKELLTVKELAAELRMSVRKNVGKWPLTVGRANSLWEADDKLL